LSKEVAALRPLRQTTCSEKGGDVMNLPLAKTTNLLTTELEDEVVVYDPERKQAHSLNRTAVAVWNHCDGETSIGELQRRVSTEVGASVSEEAIWLALQKLERAHLLAEKLVSAGSITRREALEHAGRLGAAAMVATPLVFTAAVPAAAAVCSPCGILPSGTTVGTCACVDTTDTVPQRKCVATSAFSTACTTSDQCVAGVSVCVAHTVNGNPPTRNCFLLCNITGVTCSC
jgi:hypothetical protein